MHAVSCRTSGIHEIELIRPLWEQLNEHHHEKASHFKALYKRMTFKDRRSHFCKLDEYGQLRLDLAADMKTGKEV